MFSLRVALRYLFSRKSHNAVNVISIVSMAGVAVATAAILCVLSVFNGFSDLAMSRLSRINPDLAVLPVEGKVMESADSLATVLAQIDGVECAMPTLTEQAMAIYRGRQMPVTVKGVPQGYDRVVSIDSVIIDGEFQPRPEDFALDERFATLSVGTAISLDARPGYSDYLRLFTPRRTGKINTAMPMSSFREDSLIVSGVYQVNESDYDADRMIAELEPLRRMLDYTDEASAIELRIAPGADPSTVRKAVEAAIVSASGTALKVLDRLQVGEAPLRMIEIEKWITFAMLVFILIIASFNVISTLSMLIIEKEANIATMRAMGATSRQISRIFLLEGWMISVIGGIVGVVLGLGLCLAQQWGGFIKLAGDPTQLSITVYPVRVEAPDVMIVLAVVVITGWAIGFITSHFISRR